MTILFMEDWAKYPSAIIHHETKNTSFLRFAALLKTMGIRNNSFALSLINPELVHIDPHDPHLTIDQMVKVGIECRLNHWYYLREVVRAAPLASSIALPVNANRGIISMYWLYLNHVTNLLIQIRQTGKTFGIGTLANNILHITGQNKNVIFFTKDSGVRADMLDKMRDLESALPPYLVRRVRNDVSNTEEIKLSQPNNKFTGVISNSSEKLALKAARGYTAPDFFIDEAAFVPNIRTALPAALAAGIRARDAAKAAGTSYGTLITTTAGKLDSKEGSYIYSLLLKSFPWNEVLYDCENQEDLYETISKNNMGVVRVNSTFNHRQLGYSDQWLREKIKETLAEGQDAERDLLNKWTNGNERSPFPQEILDIIKGSRVEPVYVQRTDKHYLINWYVAEDSIKTFMETGPFVLGVDTSDATGGDNIAIVMKSVYSGATICTATINETYVLDFCVWLCDFLVTYKNVTAIIEKRSTGIIVLEYLLKMLPNYNEDPYVRLFNRIINDREEDVDRFKEATQPLFRKDLSLLTINKKHFGFATSGSGLTSRSDLYSLTLQDAAKKTGSLVKDDRLINELAGLTIKNNRVDHSDGGHDDMVIAWLLCHWFMTSAQNLYVYGIDASKVLFESRFTTRTENLTRYDIESDLKIKNEIDRILENIKNANDSNLAYIYEKQVRYLATQIKNQDFLSTLSIDDYLSKIKEQKTLRNSAARNEYSTSARYQNAPPMYQTSSYLWGRRST